MDLTKEITGDDLNKEQGLFVFIGKKQSTVTSLAKAARLYSDFLESEHLGVREAPLCKVRKAFHKEVFATVSYNGRVWEA